MPSETIYQTVQVCPGIAGRCVGPLFSNVEAAKETLEAFVRDELDDDGHPRCAACLEWEGRRR